MLIFRQPKAHSSRKGTHVYQTELYTFSTIYYLDLFNNLV